jgi:hypothetical protein
VLAGLALSAGTGLAQPGRAEPKVIGLKEFKKDTDR